MSKKEILCALRHCVEESVECQGCPAYVDAEHSRCREVLAGALALIEAQQKGGGSNGGDET